jgi:2',3'-cyclic-nucleotide 2'-phosphodiesterase (5'-nucleotidase family)
VKAQLGGLARRATTLTELINKGHTVLHFDAGDAFFPRYDVRKEERKAVEDMATLYIRSFNLMKLAAYTVGDRDLVVGIPLLKKLEKKASFPFLSANVRNENGTPVFTPSILIKKAGLSIGVIGATTALMVNGQVVRETYKIDIKPPANAVRDEAAKLKKQGAQLLILLSHLNATELAAVAKLVPDIHIVLGGQDMRMEHSLKRVGNAFAGNGFMKGKYVSVMDLFIRNESLAFVDRNARSSLENRKRALEGQVRSRERSLDLTKKQPNAKNRVEIIERMIVQAKSELQEVEMDLEEVQDPDPNASHLRRTVTPLNKTIADEPTCAKWVAAYRKIHPDPKRKRRAPSPKKASKRPAQPVPRR